MVAAIEDPADASWARDEEDLEEDDARYEALARPMTASCVNDVLRRANDPLAAPPSPGAMMKCVMRVGSVSPSNAPGGEAFSATGAAVMTPPHASRSKRCTERRCMGAPAIGAQAARGAEIARVLAAPKCSTEVREYAASLGGGYGKVPAFLHSVAAHLDAEQRYIVSLHEPREAPRRRMRLLAKSEKERALNSLRQQLQRVRAAHAQAKPKSGSKQKVEAELQQIKKDLAHFDRPYVFVEDR